MARQMQRTRPASKPAEQHIEEQPERDDHAEEISEQAACCLTDIDAAIEEACCVLAEVAEVVERTPTEEEFTAERNRLKTLYYDTRIGSAEEDEAWAAVMAYEEKWPQYAHLCTC